MWHTNAHQGVRCLFKKMSFFGFLFGSKDTSPAPPEEEKEIQVAESEYYTLDDELSGPRRYEFEFVDDDAFKPLTTERAVFNAAVKALERFCLQSGPEIENLVSVAVSKGADTIVVPPNKFRLRIPLVAYVHTLADRGNFKIFGLDLGTASSRQEEWRNVVARYNISDLPNLKSVVNEILDGVVQDWDARRLELEQKINLVRTFVLKWPASIYARMDIVDDFDADSNQDYGHTTDAPDTQPKQASATPQLADVVNAPSGAELTTIAIVSGATALSVSETAAVAVADFWWNVLTVTTTAVGSAGKWLYDSVAARTAAATESAEALGADAVELGADAGAEDVVATLAEAGADGGAEDALATFAERLGAQETLEALGLDTLIDGSIEMGAEMGLVGTGVATGPVGWAALGIGGLFLIGYETYEIVTDPNISERKLDRLTYRIAQKGHHVQRFDKQTAELQQTLLSENTGMQVWHFANDKGLHTFSAAHTVEVVREPTWGESIAGMFSSGDHQYYNTVEIPPLLDGKPISLEEGDHIAKLMNDAYTMQMSGQSDHAVEIATHVYHVGIGPTDLLDSAHVAAHHAGILDFLSPVWWIGEALGTHALAVTFPIALAMKAAWGVAWGTSLYSLFPRRKPNSNAFFEFVEQEIVKDFGDVFHSLDGDGVDAAAVLRALVESAVHNAQFETHLANEQTMDHVFLQAFILLMLRKVGELHCRTFHEYVILLGKAGVLFTDAHAATWKMLNRIKFAEKWTDHSRYLFTNWRSNSALCDFRPMFEQASKFGRAQTIRVYVQEDAPPNYALLDDGGKAFYAMEINPRSKPATGTISPTTITLVQAPNKWWGF